MNGTNGTRGTGTGPVPSGPLSVKDAALYLHITPRAVRKRIHAGTLMGEQIDGEWQVYPQAIRQGRPLGNLDGSAAQGRRTGEPGSWTAEPSKFPAATSSAAAMMEQVLAPLIAQIGDLREELGQEKTLRSLAERRTAALEQQLARQAAPSISMAREQPASALASTVAPPAHPRSILGRAAVWVAKRSG
jgi:predicted ArsR family transcriptional regulator